MARARWVLVGVGVVACGRSGDASRRPPPTDAVIADAGAAAALVDAAIAVGVAVPAGPYRGPDCQAAYAPRPDRDAAPMCFEPGGTFVVGAPPGELNDASRPQRRVTLSPFFIDQFEVTRAQFARFLNEAQHGLGCDELGIDLCPGAFQQYPWAIALLVDGAAVAQYGEVPRGTRTYAARPGEARLPMVEVSAAAADAYCAWVGKALPTHAQWEFAARVEPLTGALRRFPWGDRFARRLGNCNEYVCLDGSTQSGPVDAFPRDVSATGVRNLFGNVSEWVRECAAPAIPPCGDCVDPVVDTPCAPRGSEGIPDAQSAPLEDTPPNHRQIPGELHSEDSPSGRYGRAIRGGSWRDPPNESAQRPPQASGASNETGFRCIHGARPGSGT
ncbi:MAG: SUMF1/EgtB/PvdO family nonheme iron enzyme [Myxococcales bacterium]|nr:SUMF1/EgtB/PvdO family nonheme iron enzyme [Myxococcales bacterium]